MHRAGATRLQYLRIARLTAQIHQFCMAGLANRPAPTSAQIGGDARFA